MRKLFSFFVMAVVLGMASCGDGNDPNDPNTPFKLEVQNLTDESADIVVTPASDAAYLWTNVEQRFLVNHHFAKLEDYVANLLSTTTYAKMETAGQVLSGSKTIPLSGLKKNNAYYFVVFRVDEEFKLSGEVYSVKYTPQDPQDPQDPQGSQDKVPAVPTGLTIQKIYDEAGILTWNPVPGATEYRVYIRTSTSSDPEWYDRTPQTVTEPKYEYDLEEYMGDFSTYVSVEMRVSAVNQKGESEKSEPVTDFYGY